MGEDKDPPPDPLADTRTLKDLADEVYLAQDACNLSGVVHSWSKSISRLRELLPDAGTHQINIHPINTLWADKVAQLAEAHEGHIVAGAWEMVQEMR